MLVIAIINLTVWIESKIHNLQLLFIHRVPNIPPRLLVAIYSGSLEFSKYREG